METLFQSPVKIVLRFQDSPDEDLEVAAAFAKRPHTVRDALLEAIRHVQLGTTDITLLWIENAFHSALKQPWKEQKYFRPVLEACRQGKLRNRTERLFFEHGEEYGVVALGVATNKNDHKILREIDQLADNDLIKLAKNVQKIPKRATLVEFVERFLQSPQGVVSEPPPHLPRPRTRRKVTPPSPPTANPDSSNVSQRNKRRRLSSVSDTIAQRSPQVELPLPSADDITLSKVCQPPPPPPIFPLQPTLANYQSLSISEHANIQQQSPSSQEEQWDVPQNTRSHISINDPQQSQTMGLEGQWDVPQNTRSHISINDPQQSQTMGLEGQWDFPGGEFTQGRPYRYEPEPLQIGQGGQWLFPEQDFTRGRPDRYDPQSAQVQVQNAFQF